MEHKLKCNCENYAPLELLREQIAARIKQNKVIGRTLECLVESTGANALYRCRVCGQYWQQSLAWNWGGRSFFFKIPAIEIQDWKEVPFMSPADMMIHAASMQEYFAKNAFVESEEICRVENCENKCIAGKLVCKRHFVQDLQKVGLLPKPPSGRIFEPYT